jgi:hypothetical protein
LATELFIAIKTRFSKILLIPFANHIFAHFFNPESYPNIEFNKYLQSFAFFLLSVIKTAGLFLVLYPLVTRTGSTTMICLPLPAIPDIFFKWFAIIPASVILYVSFHFVHLRYIFCFAKITDEIPYWTRNFVYITIFALLNVLCFSYLIDKTRLFGSLLTYSFYLTAIIGVLHIACTFFFNNLRISAIILKKDQILFRLSVLSVLFNVFFLLLLAFIFIMFPPLKKAFPWYFIFPALIILGTPIGIIVYQHIYYSFSFNLLIPFYGYSLYSTSKETMDEINKYLLSFLFLVATVFQFVGFEEHYPHLLSFFRSPCRFLGLIICDCWIFPLLPL